MQSIKDYSYPDKTKYDIYTEQTENFKLLQNNLLDYFY